MVCLAGRNHSGTADLRSKYFQVDYKIFQQKDGMAMWSSISPINGKIYMEHFDKLALVSV
jgi:hypothetical protein